MSIERATALIDQYIEKVSQSGDPALTTYMRGQRLRYIYTLAYMPGGGANSAALEIATTEVFNELMVSWLDYSRVDCTVWLPQNKEMRWHWKGSDYFNLNLERDTVLCADQTYDLVFCAEVLEHMSVDPMFMLAEFNRILKPGGRVFVTTPNITSTRAIWKLLNGEAPYLFHQYLVPITSGRHHLEYSPALLREIMEAAGFDTESFWTVDAFETPVKAVVDVLNEHGMPTEMRGDNLFYIGRKTSRVRDRYPSGLYFNTQ